jgi:hypothetical protein
MGTKEREDVERAINEGPRSATRFLEMVADGDLHAELSDTLHELIDQLANHAITVTSPAKGELAIKLKFSVDKSGVVDVAWDMNAKAPKPARSKGVMWLTKGNNLTAQNPRQQKLPLREVPQASTEVREANDGAKGAVREV